MKKILVVDDDPDMLVNIKAALSKQGYHVTTTITCNEGLGLVNKFKPDVILLDINVGDEDGREMCKQIKESAESKHIPVILLSANHEAVLQYAAHGASGGFEKPFHMANVLRLVGELLEPPGTEE